MLAETYKAPSNFLKSPQGGASLMIAFRCTRKNVLVIGYDEIAASRVLSALEADAKVTLVGPLSLMCEELLYRIQDNQVEWLGERFEEEQLIGNHLVFVCRSDDIKLCQAISHSCCARRIPVNVANQKDLSDFDMTCSYRDQSLQVAVSTNGLSAVNLTHRILQSKISSSLSPSLGEAVKNVGLLREGIEQLDPGASNSLRRYQWLSHICEYYSLERLASLTKGDIRELLKTYEGGQKLEKINLKKSPISFLSSSSSEQVIQADIIFADNVQFAKSFLKLEGELNETPNNVQEIVLKALQEGKRVVRLTERSPQELEKETMLYRQHGYIPLFLK